jgi:GWxTD domain-containing protein
MLAAPIASHAQLAPLERTDPWRPATVGVARVADSLAQRGDTAQALALLRQVLTPYSKDADAWHRYGLLLWQSTGSRRDGYMRDIGTIRTLSTADSALRMATKLASDRAEFWATLARFNLNSGAGSVRYAATQEWERAAREAERVGDTAQIALAAAESGLAAWRRYLGIRNRALMSEGRTIRLQTNMRWERRLARDYVEAYLRRIAPPTGISEYELALSRFRQAERLAPASLRNARLLYMALADGDRWSELLSVANRRAAASTFDGQARFARGLAQVRLGQLAPARAAFDSALVTLEDSERARIFSLTRLLAPGGDIAALGGLDSAAWVALQPDARRAANAFFWATRDPDASTLYNELELEFLARVTFAEFAWSDDELGLQGADTERAEIYVRYGPPDEILTIAGAASVISNELIAGVDRATSSRDDFASTLLWFYRSGTVFFFDLPPGYGTARLPNVDRGYIRDVQRASPVRWDNVALPAEIDSSLLRVTRFRAGADSAELLIVAQVPRAALRDSSVAAASSAVLSLRLVDDRATITPIATDTLPLVGSPLATRTWVARQAARAGIVQLESRVPDVPRVSRGLVVTDGPLAAGFTLSDLVLGTPRPATARAASRWSALPLTPTIGRFQSGAPVAVGWELYDAARDTVDGSARLRLALTVERIDRGGLSGMALRVLNSVGEALGATQPTRDGLALTYDQTIPLAAGASTAVLAESITLDGFGARTGTYRLTLTVADLVSGKRTTRATTFRIAADTP